MAALAVAEMRSRGWKARVARSGPSLLAGPPGARRAPSRRRGGRARGAARRGAARAAPPAVAPGGGRQSGQALPAVLAACAVLGGCALILASIGGAVTGKQRVQRAADLSALSATRAMRDSMPRLLAPARLPDGRPNPRHLSRAAYLREARARRRGGGRAERGGPAAAADHLPGRDGDAAAARAGPGPSRDRRGRAARRRAARGRGGGERGGRAGADPGGGDRRRRGRARGRPPRPGPGPRGRRPAAGTAGRSSTGTARGCAPTWRPPTTGWPPPRRRRATR